jgi:signal transduction histidine kinase
VRLFLLLWLTLVASTILGFSAFRATSGIADRPGAGPAIPRLPGLPPDVVFDGRPPLPHPPAPDARPARPHGASLWLDLAVRVLVIGAAAAWAARWLTAPMRRLAEAARQMRAAFAVSGPGTGAVTPPQVDDTRGTVEVRAAAQVFNQMARQLKADFDAQRLLLATVSHDLRTPLARLRLRLDAMEAAGGAPARAIADVREMDELLEGLLDLFRTQPEAAADTPGAVRAAPSKVDATALVQALIDDLPPGAPAVVLSGGEAVVGCGPMALRRIVQNLLGNALRHSDDVAVDIVVDGGEGTERVDGAGAQEPRAAGRAGRARVRIRIDDRGPGLSTAQLALAGTPFTQWNGAAAPAASSSVDGRHDRAGLGLGLHIARVLAERAGGAVALSARPGGGLRAELTLPAA